MAEHLGVQGTAIPTADNGLIQDDELGGSPIARVERPRERRTRATTACKTCRKCRAKKIRCDGIRPRCGSCSANDVTCLYPEDGRRSTRPSNAEIRSMTKELVRLRELYQNRLLPDSADRSIEDIPRSEAQPEALHYGSTGYVAEKPSGTYPSQEAFPAQASSGPLPRRSTSRTGLDERRIHRQTAYGGLSSRASPEAEADIVEETQQNRREQQVETTNGPSPTEAYIVGAVSEKDGLSIHGVTSTMHDSSPPLKSYDHVAIDGRQYCLYKQMAKDRLISNAATQAQREPSIMRSLKMDVDTDGVEPEMACHLLDLHWNRQHFAYLITYRPAVIDSLATAGPYANKLLLNAIYYSSCLYSDRPALQADAENPYNLRSRFYRRFKELLIDELERPSLATIAALLLMGASYVSSGKPSIGWTICGTSYRMLIDLGCHLSMEPRSDKIVFPSMETVIDREIRTRIYWGAYLTDKFQSLYLGRPSALHPREARVPKVILDTFEELHEWSPYVDPMMKDRIAPLPYYEPRPAYAVTTFQVLTVLGEIAWSIADTFYAMDSIKRPAEDLLKLKQDIEARLTAWFHELPQHLHFRPGIDPTPPPHQITPHTTYFTLIILLERPFLANGHLSFASDQAKQSVGEEKCAGAAVQIWHLVDAYKVAFTLRRAPYLLSYATYSAVVVILNQTYTDRNHFVDCIRFFWFALLDLQRGCNFGLGKPLKILRALMERLGEEIPGQASVQSQSMDINVAYQPAADGHAEPATHPDLGPGELHQMDFLLQQSMEFNDWESGLWLDSMMHDETMVDGSLYGLFTSGQTAIPPSG